MAEFREQGGAPIVISVDGETVGYIDPYTDGDGGKGYQVYLELEGLITPDGWSDTVYATPAQARRAVIDQITTLEQPTLL